MSAWRSPRFGLLRSQAAYRPRRVSALGDSMSAMRAVRCHGPSIEMEQGDVYSFHCPDDRKPDYYIHAATAFERPSKAAQRRQKGRRGNDKAS